MDSFSKRSEVTVAAPPPAIWRDRQTLRWAAAVAWTLVIMALCWLPSEFVHEVEGSSSWFEIPNLDKVVHSGIFVVFALLWARVWTWPQRNLWVVNLGLGLALLTEFVQGLPIIGRDAGLDDAIADFAGVVIGIAIIPLVEPLFRAIENRLFGESTA